jgi:hypothetical protein
MAIKLNPNIQLIGIQTKVIIMRRMRYQTLNLLENSGMRFEKTTNLFLLE